MGKWSDMPFASSFETLQLLQLLTVAHWHNCAMHMQVRPVTTARTAMHPDRIGTACWQTELQTAKQATARELQDNWQQQVRDKAEQLKQYADAEEAWPYSPPKQAHARVALTPPKHAADATVPAWAGPPKRSLV